jgi:glycosyltransferase involved in cell wall biosynthesis
MAKNNFQPMLSVLIPTISQRSEEANALFNRLELQAAPYPVEILMLRDNKRSGIGEARNKLLRASSGKFITFIDDDDDFSDDYFKTVLPMLSEQADVISYNQRADVDGAVGEVRCSLKHDNMPFMEGRITLRKPWFWCAWNRELALSHAVPKVNEREDVLWLRHLWAEAETEINIPKILHHYNFRSDKTTLQ